MNYEALYVNLLLKHGTEEKHKDRQYYERHHVLPKSMGGSDSPDNLVYLSGRVHFIVHYVLYKLHKSAEMATAFYGMCDLNRRPKRHRPLARQYHIARKAFAEHSHMHLQKYKDINSDSAKKQWAEPASRAKLLEKLMPMFSDENHPMCMKGKTGDAHPLSRAIQTPKGRFGSVREAGKAFCIAHNVISRRCKSDRYPDYYYLD